MPQIMWLSCQIFSNHITML